MDKLTSYDICTKYGCLSRIFTLITYYIIMKTSDYTIYSIVVILLWIILRAVIIALILYFSWSAIIPNVFPTEAIIYTISPSLCFKIGLLLSIIKKL